MPKKKIKVGELTLNRIIKIAEKYKRSCTKCPLYEIYFVNCQELCEKFTPKPMLMRVKKEYEKEIEVEEDV